jgi:hypothetical protein
MEQEVNEYCNSPITKGGASYSTHKLVQVSSKEYVFKPKIFSYILSGVIIFLGLSFCVGFTIGAIETKEIAALFCAPFGLFFIWAGTWLLRVIKIERSIDLVERKVKIPKNNLSFDVESILIDFSDIVAIQIVEQRINTGKNRYDSYELNIILKNLERLNILAHAGGNQILEEAQKIARFIGCDLIVDADLQGCKKSFDQQKGIEASA